MEGENLKIGDILDRCNDVPDNVRPILGHKKVRNAPLIRLLNALKKIEGRPCFLMHENPEENTIINGGVDTARYCKKRPYYAVCAHVGDIDFNYARKDAAYLAQKYGSLRPTDNNNAIVTMQHGAALLLALGHYNDDADGMLTQLNEAAYQGAQMDQKAIDLYQNASSADEIEGIKQYLGEYQKRQSAKLLEIRDQILAKLEDSMGHFIHNSQQPRAGTLGITTNRFSATQAPAWVR